MVVMNAEPTHAFREVVDAYERWRDKCGLTRQERSAALAALSSFVHEMGWTKLVQDELEQRSRRRR
jgi:hypothetical protein